ncbi:LOW QUALITY PROTEIN: hypothetical protein Cgig2_019239 [Carnegiea gigantea]|uniref:Uncharacterized protein n=1 Tax=Carnegiea gigantea TaxID=171969 RepID=A0A9Q1JG34_9CARY|nr:LOW QUALITY PROTEIN: hypothetical protein Cgig2_019239 [Carnegiea gigantea]
MRGSQLPQTECASRFEQSDPTELDAIHDESACLCYLDHVVFNLRFGPRQFPTLRGWTNDEIKLERGSNSKLDLGYIDDALDKTTIANEEEEVNEEEHRNKVMTKLEEFLPSTCTLLKRVRKEVTESMSHVLIRATPKKSKSRSSVLLQDWYESEGLFGKIDMIEKHFVGSLDTSLPNGVVLVYSEPDILTTEVQVLNYDVENVLTRGIMSSAHINTPLPVGTSSRSLVAEFLMLFDESKWHYGFASFLTIII